MFREALRVSNDPRNSQVLQFLRGLLRSWRDRANRRLITDSMTHQVRCMTDQDLVWCARGLDRNGYGSSGMFHMLCIEECQRRGLRVPSGVADA